MTPSLSSFILSLVAGALLVIGPISVALVIVSANDRITRG